MATYLQKLEEQLVAAVQLFKFRTDVDGITPRDRVVVERGNPIRHVCNGGISLTPTV